mgnify:CR=1 FL=1
MIRKVLNTRLYQKIFAEQAHFKDWLLSRTPEEILSYARKYNCREDILLSLEYNNLSPKQEKILLKPRTDRCVQKWVSHGKYLERCENLCQ